MSLSTEIFEKALKEIVDLHYQHSGHGRSYTTVQRTVLYHDFKHLSENALRRLCAKVVGEDYSGGRSLVPHSKWKSLCIELEKSLELEKQQEARSKFGESSKATNRKTLNAVQISKHLRKNLPDLYDENGELK